MKIAFIRPSMFGERATDAMKPLIFSIIKPLTPAFAKIIFYDEMIEKLPDNINADVIAMTVDTFSAQRAYQLAKIYKKQGRLIIMGGFHPTMVPDECLNFADSVILGEAEDTWSKVILDIKNNTLQKKYISENNCDLGTVKYDYSVFQGKKYNPVGLVQFSRGCRFNCDFCSINGFYKGKIRIRPIENVVEDIKNTKEKYIFFIDDNLFTDEREARKLFEAMIPLKKKWVCQISIDIGENKELLELMKKSGCLMVLIGFESLNTGNLKQMGKSENIKNIEYDRIIKKIYDAGMMIYGTFVIGYDYDNKDSAMELAEFAMKNSFAIANFNPLMAMPGTRLYDRLKDENRLTCDDWWTNENFRYGDAMLYPRGMTGEDLQKGCKNARYLFSSYKSIFKRLFCKANFRSLSNAYLYLALNIISHIQIKNKQGRKLGGIYEDYTD